MSAMLPQRPAYITYLSVMCGNAVPALKASIAGAVFIIWGLQDRFVAHLAKVNNVRLCDGVFSEEFGVDHMSRLIASLLSLNGWHRGTIVYFQAGPWGRL